MKKRWAATVHIYEEFCISYTSLNLKLKSPGNVSFLFYRLYFPGFQDHCRPWLQPWNQKTLAPWKKSYDTPRKHIKKQRHHFGAKHPYSQSYGFFSSYVWMWELDHKKGWMSKKWCFELWRWRLLRVPWTTRRPDKSILKEVNPEYSLEGLMVKSKLQHFGHLMQRADLLERPWC